MHNNQRGTELEEGGILRYVLLWIAMSGGGWGSQLRHRTAGHSHTDSRVGLLVTYKAT